ncbi:MAG TPA: PAS domain-containing protein [Pyrinomonadaceae bacterium]|nr:PAS domain-containing protein [Pyrinomonadaceae bacterium]
MPSNRRAFVTDADVTSGLLCPDFDSQPFADNQIVFTLDAVGNFSFVNNAGERLCGYSRGELRRMNVAQIIKPCFANYMRQQLRRNLRQRFGMVYEVEVLTKQGRSVMLEISIHLVRGSQRAIEIHGIAFQPKEPEHRLRPRCLDERFAFDARVQLTR